MPLIKSQKRSEKSHSPVKSFVSTELLWTGAISLVQAL